MKGRDAQREELARLLHDRHQHTLDPRRSRANQAFPHDTVVQGLSCPWLPSCSGVKLGKAQLEPKQPGRGQRPFRTSPW